MEASGSASGGTRSRKGRNRKKGERSRGGGSADEPHDTAGGGAVQARPRAGEQSNAGVVGGLNGDDGGRNGKEAATAGEEGSAAEPHWSHDADGDTVQATPPRAGEQSSAGGRREVLNGATEQERLLLDGDQALPLGDHHGEQAPGPGEGQRRRRREKRNRKKMSKGDTAGEGSASEPHGSRDGDTAGGHAVQAAPPRAGEQTTGGGGRGGLNGEANQEEPKTGRNDRVEEERPDLGRVQPLQVQSDDQQLGDEGGLDGEAGKEERRSLDGGLAPQLVDHHHQQQGAGGGHNGNTEPESLLLGVPMPGGDGAAGSNGSPARRRVVPSQEDGAREEGDGPGRAAAMTSRQLAAGAVEPATPIASPSMSLPKCTFLSEALLSWTVADVLDENFYKHKVNKIPNSFDSTEHFADIHRPLLLEEVRATLSSAIHNPKRVQFCELLSVDQCGSHCVYLDINLDASNPDDFLCRHIARDYDVCLLTCKPLKDTDLDVSSSALGIVVGVGRDTFFQRGFKMVVSNPEQLKSLNLKYVSFLTNVQYQLELSDILSHENEMSIAAIQGVIELDKKVTKLGKSCAESTGCNVVWTPLGSTSKYIVDEVKEFVKSKKNVLICLPGPSTIPHLLMHLKEISNNIVVLNDTRSLEAYNVSQCRKVFLEYRSHELYCCVRQCKGSLKMIYSLLDLSGFYHYKRCSDADSCPRCRVPGLLDFSTSIFRMRFNEFIEYLRECLEYLDRHGEDFSLIDPKNINIRELQNMLKEFEDLLKNSNQRDDCVAAAFHIMPGVDAALIDDSYTLAEALNRTRMSCLKLMGSLTDSLQLPNPKNRDELDKFCLKHYNIIVTTVDCTWKLLDMEMVPFDVLFVLGANQIKEAELLVPFHHPVKHTILFGDPYHLKPIIQSEMCKDAGYSASIFDKLQQMFPEAVLMLKDQSSMHPLVSKFPNDYFYKGKLKDGCNVKSSENNKKFGPMKTYGLIDIPLKEMRSRTSHVNLSSIFILLQLLCKGSNPKFEIAVVCMSSDEADIVRECLRSKKEIHDKVNLDVKSLDCLEEEQFDMIILSVLGEDETELKAAMENNIYVAFTCSRRYFWIVGESSALIDVGGIWKTMVTDATKRGFYKKLKSNVLSDAIKQFVDRHNIVEPQLKLTHPLGQELNWAGRPYKTKNMLPPVQDQRGHPDMCTFYSILAVVEALFKFLYADLVPPQEFKWTFLKDSIREQYEIIIKKAFLSEDRTDRGRKRMENALTAFKDLGVKAINESGSEVRSFNLPWTISKRF